MLTKAVLSVLEITRILAAARETAETNGWVVTIAIVDDGGHLLGLLRLDGSAPLSAVMATEKARTAALSRKESKQYETQIAGGRTALLSAPLKAMMEGGVPIVVDGQVIGAVGVSGSTAAQDAQIARAGIQAMA
jgi:glc operon protein GlcG